MGLEPVTTRWFSYGISYGIPYGNLCGRAT